MKEEKLMPNWERFSNFEVGSSGVIDTSDIKVIAFIGWNSKMGSVRGDGLVYATNERVPSSAQLNATKGNSVTIEAVPLAGYHFVKWTGGPIDGSTQKKATFTLTAPCAIKAVFEADNVTVTSNNSHAANNTNNVVADNPLSGNEPTQDTVVYSTPQVPTFNLKAFVKKWWWAILIVAYIIWKEAKGGKQ